MNPLYAFSPVCEQTLRALARYPQRTAFAWPGGSLTYQGATDLIGRMPRASKGSAQVSNRPIGEYTYPTPASAAIAAAASLPTGWPARSAGRAVAAVPRGAGRDPAAAAGAVGGTLQRRPAPPG